MGCSHKARWRDRRATARSTAYLCKLRCRWWTGSTNHRPLAWTLSAGDHRTLCASRQRPASTRIGSDCWTNRGRARRQEDRLSYGTYQKTNCITEYCCITLNVGQVACKEDRAFSRDLLKREDTSPERATGSRSGTSRARQQEDRSGGEIATKLTHTNANKPKAQPATPHSVPAPDLAGAGPNNRHNLHLQGACWKCETICQLLVARICHLAYLAIRRREGTDPWSVGTTSARPSGHNARSRTAPFLFL